MKKSNKINKIKLANGKVIDISCANDMYLTQLDCCGPQGIRSDGSIYIEGGTSILPDGTFTHED